MRQIVDCLIVVALCEFLYFNLTAIPQQDYIHNNPWSRTWVRK